MKTHDDIVEYKYFINQLILRSQKRIDEDTLMMDEGEYSEERDTLISLLSKRDALQWVLMENNKL
jgi:hypothetical protein